MYRFECHQHTATAMLLTGATYSENSKGPSTEPCGTPDSQGTVTDLSPPAATVNTGAGIFYASTVRNDLRCRPFSV